MLTQTLVLKRRATLGSLAHRLRKTISRSTFVTPDHSLSFTKRVLDLGLCLLLLPIVLPVVGLIALFVWKDSSRPIFFVQERIGKSGRRFRIYKFRTLCKDYRPSADREYMQAYVRGVSLGRRAPEEKEIHKPFDSGQTTRIGRFLRKTSLDELPQLLNVICGNMSLVGPRPNILWEVEAYHIWHTERLDVLPGITGLAQVRGRSGIPFDQIARYDIEYIRKRSLKLDLQIMWWTVASIVRGKGAG